MFHPQRQTSCSYELTILSVYIQIPHSLNMFCHLLKNITMLSKLPLSGARGGIFGGGAEYLAGGQKRRASWIGGESEGGGF